MCISKEILAFISDGDFHTVLDNVEYSTNLRAIVTVGYMEEHIIQD